jgi:hemin uptake protein HemP
MSVENAVARQTAKRSCASPSNSLPAAEAMTENDSQANVQDSNSPGTLCRPIDSTELFRDTKAIFIRHGEELYRLTITRNDKLILQK